MNEASARRNSNSAVPGGLPSFNNPALHPHGRLVAYGYKCHRRNYSQLLLTSIYHPLNNIHPHQPPKL